MTRLHAVRQHPMKKVRISQDICTISKLRIQYKCCRALLSNTLVLLPLLAKTLQQKNNMHSDTSTHTHTHTHTNPTIRKPGVGRIGLTQKPRKQNFEHQASIVLTACLRSRKWGWPWSCKQVELRTLFYRLDSMHCVAEDGVVSGQGTELAAENVTAGHLQVSEESLQNLCSSGHTNLHSVAE